MKDWLKIIPEDERKAYEKGGFMNAGVIGERTALVVVDVTYGFCGSEGATLDEAIAEFGPACGPVSWETMPRIAALIALFRELGRPVVFTRSDLGDVQFVGKATKSKRLTSVTPPRFNDFPESIAPQSGEWENQSQRLLPDTAGQLHGSKADRLGRDVRRVHVWLRARLGGGFVLERIQHVCGRRLLL